MMEIIERLARQRNNSQRGLIAGLLVKDLAKRRRAHSYSLPFDGKKGYGTHNHVVSSRGKHPILICAHYDAAIDMDHETTLPGANDNGSGVAALYALGKTLPADWPVDFAIFGGEEAGHLGALKYIADLNGKRPRCVVNIDTCAAGDGITIPYFPRALPHLRQVAKARLAEQFVELANIYSGAAKSIGLPVTRRDRNNNCSDDENFMQAGIPAILVTGNDPAFFHEGPEERRIIHTHHDLPSRISNTLLENVVKAVIGGTEQIQSMPYNN